MFDDGAFYFKIMWILTAKNRLERANDKTVLLVTDAPFRPDGDSINMPSLPRKRNET
jgi:hypothetical protein